MEKVTYSGWDAFGKKVPHYRKEKGVKMIKETFGIESSETINSILDKFVQNIENDTMFNIIDHSRSLEKFSPLKMLSEGQRYMLTAELCTD